MGIGRAEEAIVTKGNKRSSTEAGKEYRSEWTFPAERGCSKYKYKRRSGWCVEWGCEAKRDRVQWTDRRGVATPLSACCSAVAVYSHSGRAMIPQGPSTPLPSCSLPYPPSLLLPSCALRKARPGLERAGGLGESTAGTYMYLTASGTPSPPLPSPPPDSPGPVLWPAWTGKRGRSVLRCNLASAQLSPAQPGQACLRDGGKMS